MVTAMHRALAGAPRRASVTDHALDLLALTSMSRSRLEIPVKWASAKLLVTCDPLCLIWRAADAATVAMTRARQPEDGD
jgi:hypothetical protein